MQPNKKTDTQHRIKLIASCFLFGNLLRDSFVLLIFKVKPNTRN